MVKVGDYGLSKSISSSQRTAQTQSVGTVHYMAPEISTGNYNKQIDIYAAGVILYEMLTGRVPFDGESAGEILMKHLTSPPDLSKLPTEYVPIVPKALAKNPAQRYASMAEMARDVEGRPASKGRRPRIRPPAPRLGAVAGAGRPPRRPGDGATAAGADLDGTAAVSRREQIMELCGPHGATVVFAALATALWGALSQNITLARLSSLFFLTVAASWTILIPGKFWTERRGDSWTRRMVMMVLGGGRRPGGGLWLEGWSPGLDAGLVRHGEAGAGVGVSASRDGARGELLQLTMPWPSSPSAGGA